MKQDEEGSGGGRKWRWKEVEEEESGGRRKWKEVDKDGSEKLFTVEMGI